MLIILYFDFITVRYVRNSKPNGVGERFALNVNCADFMDKYYVATEIWGINIVTNFIAR